MSVKQEKSNFQGLGRDLSAGLVVFLVAVPLCLGIALASGAPLFAGILTGIVGGLVVALLSGSHLAVSGPAAGLTVIVLNGIDDLGSYQAFLVAVVLAGVLQLIFGALKAGFIGLFFPNSVIKGLLAAIGVILILKQIPHFLGVDQEFFGNFAFWQRDGFNTFTEIFYAFEHIHPGVVIVGIVALSLLLLWNQPFIKNNRFLTNVPGALVAVIVALLLKLWFDTIPGWRIEESHLVNLPDLSSWTKIQGSLMFPDWKILQNSQVYVVAFTLAIIASIETLLSIEATDKLDPLKRYTPTNRELFAQGTGNIIAGLIGGLPMTAVIVRSTANISAGGRTRKSAFFHGVFLLISVLLIPFVLNQIPLSALAAVLLVVGYKLISVEVVKRQWGLGFYQFVPFVVTILAIVFTDLLIGVVIGLVVGTYTILRENYRHAFYEQKVDSNGQTNIHLTLSEQVTFLNKVHILRALHKVPDNSKVIIDGAHSTFIDHDVIETINDFKAFAADRNIDLELVNIKGHGRNIQKQ